MALSAGSTSQDPPNNWGDQDVEGQIELELRARGECGGENVSFGVELLEQHSACPDSGIPRIDGIVFTREWQHYRVLLEKVGVSSIRTGFVVTVSRRHAPVAVYLDSIRFVR